MKDMLRFDPKEYTRKELDFDGKKIVYKEYKSLCYCAKPVDVEYQSLTVWEPVSIDGEACDAFNAPIYFAIDVGGYMSSNNVRPKMMFGPYGPSGPGGPGGPEGSGGPSRPNGPIGLAGLGGDKGPDANKHFALSNGLVVVTPGCRGRDNQFPDGTYYGKAPAAIVDLKAAVRYLRHNRDVMPGNPDYIMSSGGSAGGALSSLLAASGNHPDYAPYLEDIGAAEEEDNIFAAAGFSPIVNLEHADGAYEWEMGPIPVAGPAAGPIKIVPGLVDQALSKSLIEAFRAYQDGLRLQGRNSFGLLTADNLGDYILKEYLLPQADRFLSTLGADEQKAYLTSHPWIYWDGTNADFTYSDFLNARGRMKGLPAFDDFEKSMAEPILFGTEIEDARHFTEFSLRQETGDPSAELSEELEKAVRMMNPMTYILEGNPGCADHWWLRFGAMEKDTAHAIFVDQVTALENLGKNVDGRMVWDGGHCADDDMEGPCRWLRDLAASNR